MSSITTGLAWIFFLANAAIDIWATLWLSGHGYPHAAFIWLFGGVPGLFLPLATPLWGLYLATFGGFLAMLALGSALEDEAS